MANITVKSENIIKTINKINKLIINYQEEIIKLISIIESNEAELDDTTQAALLTSYREMYTRFMSNKEYLDAAIQITKDIANDYKKFDTQYESAIKNVNNSL